MTRLLAAAKPYALQLGVLTVLWVAFATTTPLFGGTGAIYAVLQSFALLGLVAAGMAVTFICHELDLSVASIAALAGVVCILSGGLGLVPAILVAVTVGITFGLAQGYVISALLINSLVFTIGSQIAIRGIAYLLADDRPISLDDISVSDPMLNTWGVLAPDTLVAIIVIALLGLFLRYVKHGREMYAVGGGRKEAAAAGVPIRRPIMIAFAISGGCAALAGAMAAMKSGGASPESYIHLILNAPAAVLIGGFSLYGGRGNMINVVLGVGILAVLTVGLGASGVQAYTIDLFVGALLLAVVVGQFLLEKLAGRRQSVRSGSTMQAGAV